MIKMWWTLLIFIVITIDKLPLNVAAPLDVDGKKQLTFYEKIQSKCPNVKNDQKFAEQRFIKPCLGIDLETVETISISPTLSKSDQKALLCEILYDSLVSYCTTATSKNTTATLTSLIPEYTVAEICKNNITIVSNNTSKLYEALKDPTNCKLICEDASESPDHLCSASYYFRSQIRHPKIIDNNLKKLIQQTSGAAAAPPPPPPPPPALPLITPKAPAVVNQEKVQTAQTQTSQTPAKENADENKLQQHQKMQKQVPQVIEDHENKPPALNTLQKSDNNSIKDENNDNNESGIIGKNNEVVVEQTQNKPNSDNKAKTNSKSLATERTNGQETKVDSKTVKKTNFDEEKSKKTPKINENLEANGGAKSNVMENVKGDIQEEAVEGNDQIENNREIVDAAWGDEEAGDSQAAEEEEVKSAPASHLDKSVNNDTEIPEDSYFFSYFMILCVLFVMGYIGYHNKQKILALILEGRRGRKHYRGRRPNSANYHKLDSNLEEAISSSCSKNTTNVIY